MAVCVSLKTTYKLRTEESPDTYAAAEIIFNERYWSQVTTRQHFILASNCCCRDSVRQAKEPPSLADTNQKNI